MGRVIQQSRLARRVIGVLRGNADTRPLGVFASDAVKGRVSVHFRCSPKPEMNLKIGFRRYVIGQIGAVGHKPA
jgi:hypothetical protein